MHCIAVQPSCIAATDSERELRRAVARMNSWLGADANARQWRKYLQLNVLDTQAALGYGADIQELSELRSRFSSGAAGLDHPVFRQVQTAITNHLSSLSRRHVDINFELESSRSEFKRIKLDDLEKFRSRCIYELKLLKKYYKSDLTSRPRAQLFYQLKPDEQIQILSGLSFELPPERGRAQIQDEIEELTKRIEMINKRIEMLNTQRNQIEKWLENIQRNGPVLENQEPPGPDDSPPEPDDDSELNDLADEQSGTSTSGLIDADDAPEQPKQDQLEEIDSARMELLNFRQQLEEKIESLKDEIQQLRASEQERRQRFRVVDRQLNDFLDRFDRVAMRRNDIYFANTYEALTNLRTRYLYAANPGTPRTYLARLDDLVENVPLLQEGNDRRAAAEVGYLLGWFENAGQNLGLNAAIKSRYSGPNLQLKISSQLVNRIAAQSIQQSQRVNENVLGRLIRGSADVDSTVTIQFQPDRNQLRAAIDFTGGIDANTYTRSGRFTVYAGSRSDFNFRRDIFANVGGFYAGNVYGDLQLDSWLKGIDSRLKLVQRIANKEYCKAKYQSEAISRERTIDKVRPPFEEQTDDALEQGFDAFENFAQRQTQAGRLLPALFLHSTHDRIVLTGQRTTQFDLGATNRPQQGLSIGSDVELRLHESMLSNYASSLVAGRTFSNSQLADMFARLGGGVSDDGEEREEVSITFDDVRPIQFEFEESQFGVTISGKRFTREEQRINDGMRIRLVFRIVDNSGKMQLIPSAAPSVDLIDESRRNIGNVTFMSFLEGQLEKALDTAFEQDVMLPNNLVPVNAIPKQFQDAAKKFQLTQLRFQDGWFYAGWSQSSPGMYMNVDLPAIGLPPQPDAEAESQNDVDELTLEDTNS